MPYQKQKYVENTNF